jgi:hypothetical protein
LLLICGIISYIFLLLEALTIFQFFYIKSYPVAFTILIADIALTVALPILAYFQRFRILMIVLAIVLIILLLIKCQAMYPTVTVIYSIYALLIIGCNVHFKPQN